MAEHLVQRIATTMMTRGEVPDESRDYAAKRLSTLIEHVAEPVLFARVKLTQAPDPALERPAIAEATIDINGEIVRAQVGAHRMGEAIDMLRARLRGKLEHRAQHRQALRRRAPSSRPGEWRHGDPPTERPGYFERPAEEREVIRHKSYMTDELTPDEAAFDMEQLDFDFYLFRDRVNGDDALLERVSDGSYRLTRMRPRSIAAEPTAVALAIAPHSARGTRPRPSDRANQCRWRTVGVLRECDDRAGQRALPAV